MADSTNTLTQNLEENGSGAAARQPNHSPVAPGEIAVGVIVGRASEYFDFFVFGIGCVLVFPSVFFPFASPLEGTLYSFSIFALAFIARPFGTALFMTIQRRWGRSVKLTAALFLLGTATAGISFLPGYESLGATATGFLIFFRILQGIAYGGSWDGLPSLLALNAPEHKHSRYTMLGQLGAPIGFLLANTIFLYLHLSLDRADFLAWGWRYPFFVAFAINVVALFARLRLVLTEEYTAALDENDLEPISIREMLGLQGQGGIILIGAFTAVASYALFHIITLFPLSWIALHQTQTIERVLSIQIYGACFGILGTLVAGVITDRIGKKNTAVAMAILIGVFALFAPLLMTGSHWHQDAFICIGFVLLGISYSHSSGTVIENFNRRYRYTGTALTTDFAWLFGAAFAPLTALGLSLKFGLSAVTLYLVSAMACTLVALRINNRRKSRPQNTAE